MGGPGSGNHCHWWRPAKKAVVEDCLSIDASRWTREGLFQPGLHRVGTWRWVYLSGRECSVGYEVMTSDERRPRVRLYYSWAREATGERGDVDLTVQLTTTRPRFGGLRWWFICPLVVNGRPCQRRVGKLHLPPGARYFGCRHCHELTYTSCQESRKFDGLVRFLCLNTGWDYATAKRALNSIGRRRP